MAVTGLFNAISGLVNEVRRETRLNKIRKWDLAAGTVRRFRVDEDGRPAMDYAYRVERQEYCGSVTGLAQRSGNEEAPAGWDIQVRYDPTHPSNSSVLPSDNPYLSFEIDEDRI
jgi:hypothetical protein